MSNNMRKLGDDGAAGAKKDGAMGEISVPGFVTRGRKGAAPETKADHRPSEEKKMEEKASPSIDGEAEEPGLLTDLDELTDLGEGEASPPARKSPEASGAPRPALEDPLQDSLQEDGFDELPEEEAIDEAFPEDLSDMFDPTNREEAGRAGERFFKSRPEEQEASSKEDPPGEGGGSRARKQSARPGRVTYVPNYSEEFVPLPPMQGREEDHRSRAGTITLLAVGVFLVAAACAYLCMAWYYRDHFIRGTYINGQLCEGMTASQVEKLVSERAGDYAIEIESRNLSPERISGEEIDYRYVSDGTILKLLKEQNPLLWARGLFSDTYYDVSVNTTFDREMLQSKVLSLACAQSENQIAPENAFITLDNGNFKIVPETEGASLNVKAAYRAVNDAISDSVSEIDFTSEPEVYESAEIKSDDPVLLATMEAYNHYASARITYTFGNEEVVLDGHTLKDWMQLNSRGEIVENSSGLEQHCREYVSKLAEKYDTVGTSRTFVSTNGSTVSVYGSAYGWMIDQEGETRQLMEDISNGANVRREPVYAMRANAYGANDLGDTYIEVDMGVQHMYYYKYGQIIMDSDFVSGDATIPGRATPEGIYTLYFKQSPATLRGVGEDGSVEYETNVNFWMPFNGGVGFHDASWQPYFGGDRYLGGGSHGCINLPYDAAAYLYSIIDYGVPIICFYS